MYRSVHGPRRRLVIAFVSAFPFVGADAPVLSAFVVLYAALASPVEAQLVMSQEIRGQNSQTVTVNGGSILNVARDGDASMHISSNIGAFSVRESHTEVHIEGSLINIAEGRNRVSRINIGVNEAKKP